MTDFLTEVIDLNDLRGCPYFEPYAGGAGAALTLLARRVVSEIWINDADERVFAFWHSALNHTENFVDRIFETPLTISEWRKQREICANPRSHRRGGRWLCYILHESVQSVWGAHWRGADWGIGAKRQMAIGCAVQQRTVGRADSRLGARAGQDSSVE